MLRKLSIIILLIFSMLFTGCGTSSTTTDTNVDELKLQKKDEHFAYYCCDKDKKCLKKLSNNLEKVYPKIINKLNPEFNIKIEIWIYPSVESFHKATGTSGYVIGLSVPDNIIRMVSPLSSIPEFKYDDIIKVAIHEFTHIVTHNKNNITAFWLDEGIATYEANQNLDKTSKEIIYNKALNNELPTLTELGIRNNQIDLIYQYSYSLVEFIVNQYGYDTLNKFISSNQWDDDYKNIFGVSKEELQSKWSNFIKQNYK